MEFFGDESKVHIGEGSDMLDALFNTNCGEIWIGKYCFVGHRVILATGTHDISDTGEARMHNWIKFKDNHIKIGDGVWIGTGSIVLGPCSIGDNSVIGAGSVVLPGEYPSNALIAGNPAKFKKYINIS